MGELLDRGALEQAAALERRAVSAEELMRATLARIAARNPRVNAIVSMPDPDSLIAAARAADQQPRKGWMHGLPMAVKDTSTAAGFATSMGSPILAGKVAPADDLMVARMRAAGALFIGKTNVPELGLGSHTDNAVFGPTRNPYDPERSAGGSSGGAAVALACRMVALADGSDVMGSLRNPAGWNNVYGLRPSLGRVPQFAQGDTYLHLVATAGPMARNPRDLAALLDVQSGPEPQRPFSLPGEQFLKRIDADVKGRKVAWLGDWGGAYAMDAGVLDTCTSALALFSDIGVEVEQIEAPFDAAELWQSWIHLRAFFTEDRLAAFHRDPGSRRLLTKAALYEIALGQSLTLEAVTAASLIRSRWYARAAELFETYDALILPTAQVWPFPVAEAWPTTIAGRQMDTYHRWMEVVVPASLIGLPALSIPAGFGAAGLPMGLQVIGRHGDDLGVLQLAEAWHQATNWPDRRPPPGM